MKFCVVEKIGQIPRYRIQEFTTGVYWTGKEWSKNPDDALLYCKAKTANLDIQSLQAELNKVPVYTYSGNFKVEVQSSVPLDEKELKNWLTSNIDFNINYTEGCGPGKSLVQVSVDWNTLQERKKKC